MAKKKRKYAKFKDVKEQQAKARRRIIKELPPIAREFAAREFAKLGLYQ